MQILELGKCWDFSFIGFGGTKNEDFVAIFAHVKKKQYLRNSALLAQFPRSYVRKILQMAN